MLMLLGPERATEIMQQFSAEEVSRVSSLMSSLQALDRETLIEVLEEFRSTTQHQKTVAFNPSQFMQTLLEKFSSGASSGGWRTSEEINSQLPALESFSKMPVDLLREHLSQEHPQVAATLLSLIDPSVSAQMLETMEAEQRNALVIRIALLDRIDPSVLDDLNEVLERATQPSGLGAAGGLGGVVPVADIIANFPTGLDRQILGHIQTFDDKLASQIQDKVFMFEDFVRIAPASLQRIVSEVTAEALAGALKGAPPRLRQVFMDAMTKRMAERVQFEMDSMGPVKVQDAERRQREVIGEARKLEAQGLVSLERTSADAPPSISREA